MSHRNISLPVRVAGAILTIAAVIVVAGLAISINERAREADTATGVGTAKVGAPFTLFDTDGRPVSDRDFRGRVLLLMFARADAGERLTAAVQVASAGLGLLEAHRQGIAPVLVVIPNADAGRLGDNAAAASLIIPTLPREWTALSGVYRDVAALARAYHVPLYEPGSASKRGAPPASNVMAFVLDERGAYRSHLVMPNDPTAFAQWIAKNL